MKRALITGITGQDGSYLAELLLSKGYEVHGIVRRVSVFNTGRIDGILDKLQLHHGDVTDFGSLRRVLSETQPDEVYNLAAQSHVRVSFDQPETTASIVGLGAQNVLEAVLCTCPKARVYQASSSEMFGAAPPPQNESTPFYPCSPYGAAKCYGFYLAREYRTRGLFVANGILFNHESERRGETFVTRKITRTLARIYCGLEDTLQLGNTSASRDWGHAEDYVRAMWLMLQHPIPDDFVIATGTAHTVQEFLDACLAWWRRRAPRRTVPIACGTPRLLRAAEVDALRGDAAKARSALGWYPQISFEQLVERMCQHDADLAADEVAAQASRMSRNRTA